MLKQRETTMPPSRKSSKSKKKNGNCGCYHNPPLPGLKSKTKQKTLEESILDPASL